MKETQGIDVTRVKVDRLYQWMKGETPGPCLVTLFPTNRCNLRCTICWQRWCKVPYDEVSDERLLRLIDEGAEMGVLEWIIVGGGEPMIRGDLVIGLCERICHHGMDCSIHTNGTLFRRDHLERLVDMGLRRVVVSLDGPNAEINDHVRSKGSFEKATANLRLLKALKEEKGKQFPLTSLNTTLTNLNFDKLDRMIDLVRELGCDEGITLSSLVVEEEVCASFELSREQRAALPEHLKRAIEHAAGVRNNYAAFLPEQRATLSRLDLPDGAPPEFGSIAGARCYEPWLGLSMTADGWVGPCCAFWEEGADNLRDMSLKDVWLGPYMQKVRRQLIEDDLPSYCRRCPYTIIVRNKVLREQLLWKQRQIELQSQPWAVRAKDLAGRTMGSLKRDGWAKTLRRAKEWAQVRLRT